MQVVLGINLNIAAATEPVDFDRAAFTAALAEALQLPPDTTSSLILDGSAYAAILDGRVSGSSQLQVANDGTAKLPPSSRLPATPAPQRRRQLLQSTLPTDLPYTYDDALGPVLFVEVDPSLVSEAGRNNWQKQWLATGELLARLAGLASDKRVLAGTAGVDAVMALYREGTCGNRKCELGELVRAIFV